MAYKPLTLTNNPGNASSCFRFENEDFKVRVMYFGPDYRDTLAKGAFSPEDVFIQIQPKDPYVLPVEPEFILKTATTHHQAHFRFTTMAVYDSSNLSRLYEAADAAMGVLEGVKEVLREYFPGAFQEDEM